MRWPLVLGERERKSTATGGPDPKSRPSTPALECLDVPFAFLVEDFVLEARGTQGGLEGGRGDAALVAGRDTRLRFQGGRVVGHGGLLDAGGRLVACGFHLGPASDWLEVLVVAA